MNPFKIMHILAAIISIAGLVYAVKYDANDGLVITLIGLVVSIITQLVESKNRKKGS